ncbi:hypothetical protein V499_08695, partial [Pseudogymnoascus sp. VKM F-103]
MSYGRNSAPDLIRNPGFLYVAGVKQKKRRSATITYQCDFGGDCQTAVAKSTYFCNTHGGTAASIINATPTNAILSKNSTSKRGGTSCTAQSTLAPKKSALTRHAQALHAQERRNLAQSSVTCISATTTDVVFREHSTWKETTSCPPITVPSMSVKNLVVTSTPPAKHVATAEH